MKHLLSAAIAAACAPSLFAQELDTASTHAVSGRVVATPDGSFRLLGTNIQLVSSTLALADLPARGELDIDVRPTKSEGLETTLDVVAARATRAQFLMGNMEEAGVCTGMVAGTPGAVALVFLSPTAATSFMPVWDQSWLLGWGAGLWTFGLVDASGCFRFDLGLPAPMPVNSSWTAQAILVDGPMVHFTNSEQAIVAPRREREAGDDIMSGVTDGAIADAVVPIDFPTIQAAIDGAQDDDNDLKIEILVIGAVYDENVRITGNRSRPELPMELVGEPGDRPAIRGLGGEETLEIRSDDVSVIGFLIENVAPPGGGLGDGIEVEYSSRVRIENTVVQNCHEGIEVEESTDIQILDCVVFRNFESGVEVEETWNCSLVGNQITENSDDGLEIKECANLTLRNNDLSNNGEYGLRLEESYDVVIGGDSALLDGNRIRGNHEDGARLEEVSRLDLRNNDISENGDNGLRMRSVWNAVVQNNTIQNNDEYGMRLRAVAANYGGATPNVPPGNNVVTGNHSGNIRLDDDRRN